MTSQIFPLTAGCPKQHLSARGGDLVQVNDIAAVTLQRAAGTGVSGFVFGDTAAHCSADKNTQEFGTHQGQELKLTGGMVHTRLHTYTHAYTQTHTQIYALRWEERQMHASLPASTSSG